MTFTPRTSSTIASFHRRSSRTPTEGLERGFRFLRELSSREIRLDVEEWRFFGPWHPYERAQE